MANKLFGVMVVRNEAHRYLRESVASLRLVVDKLLVFDDGSDDGTPDIAADAGAFVVLRPAGVPAWVESEAKCREAAWRTLPRLGVDLGDWVISVDADEFVVTDEDDRRKAIETTVAEADEFGAFAVALRVHEVFGWEGDQALVRTDGFWGTIKNLRMMRWGLSLQFPDHPSSIPGRSHRSITAERFSVVHLGYARDEDRKAKHARYSTMPGHNPKHVRSILQKPKLIPWPGDLPYAP